MTIDQYQAIDKRISVRRYDMTPVPSDILAALQTRINNVKHLVPGQKTEYILVEDGKRIEKDLIGLMGRYGKFFAAPHYIIALCESDAMEPFVNAAYEFEQIILDATVLGLGTCWIGAMFNHKKIVTELGIKSGLKTMAVSPVGFPAKNPRQKFINNSIRRTAGSAKRHDLNKWVFGAAWGDPYEFKSPEDTSLKKIMEAVQSAPSWANGQPWRFMIHQDEIVLAVETRSNALDLTKIPRNKRKYYYVDGGIAICHYSLAANALGFPDAWEVGLNSREYAIPKGNEIIGRVPR